MLLALILTSCSASENKDKNTSLEQKEKIEKKEPTAQKATEAPSSAEQKVPKKTETKESLLTITTLNGKSIHVNETDAGLLFKEHKDKMVFVIFFGYRCPPCLQEMPHLIALMNKKHSDLEIIAFEAQGLDKEELIAYKKQKGINYTLAVGRENSQFIQYISSKAQWSGSIPFFIAFNKTGEVKVVHIGALNIEQLDSVYNELK
jgi:thiol-disulfide isomerase/thioredoxin